jgi:hypothetical protein
MKTTELATRADRLVLVPSHWPQTATAYYCDDDKCSELKSIDPKDLFWVAGWRGWFCLDCIANALESDEELMISETVSEWLAKNQRPTSPDRPVC